MELDVKRFYVPGGAKCTCKGCGEEVKVDYLSYPKVGERFDLWFYCPHCDTEIRKRALLTITLDLK